MREQTKRSATGAISRNRDKRVPIDNSATQASKRVRQTPTDSAGAFLAWLLSAVVAMLTASPALAELPPRVRGVVTEVSDGSIILKERDGGIVTLKTGADTSYAYVVPSNLDEIKVNDFVGAAVKGPPNSMVAVELALIPENMRAGRIAYYGWDPLPDPTASHATDTSTTNGLVAGVSPAAVKLINTKMTNGIVSAAKSDAAGRTLTVTYDGGKKSFEIAVPRNAPIVRYVLADRSAISVGSLVFIKLKAGDQADLVTIGSGVAPPM